MPVRIYDIAKKLGLESKEVLMKAKELGISSAKVSSSHLDKISAEWLEEEIIRSNLIPAAQVVPKPAEEKITGIHPTPPSTKLKVTISVTGSEIYHLFERILDEDLQLCVDIADTEHSEPLRLCLVRAATPKLSATKPKLELSRVDVDERTKYLLRAAYYDLRRKSHEDWINLAEYGNSVKKLDPTFQPHAFGERSLGLLLRRVPELFELRNDESNPIVYFLRMKDDKPQNFAQGIAPDSRMVVSPVQKLAKGKIHNLRLGFGFIMPDDGTENLFFHASDVENCTIFDLKAGDPVEYEPGTNEKGPCGRKVRRLV